MHRRCLGRIPAGLSFTGFNDEAKSSCRAAEGHHKKGTPTEADQGPDVCLWHEADRLLALMNVRFQRDCVAKLDEE